MACPANEDGCDLFRDRRTARGTSTGSLRLPTLADQLIEYYGLCKKEEGTDCHRQPSRQRSTNDIGAHVCEIRRILSIINSCDEGASFTTS